MSRAPSTASSTSHPAQKLLTLSSALLACGLCGAFVTPLSTHLPVHHAHSRSSTSPFSWERRTVESGSVLGARMSASPLDDELQSAVKGLSEQIDDLTVLVRQLAEQTPSKTEGSDQKSLNGAVVGQEASVPVVAFSGGKAEQESRPTGLVRIDGALERVDMWLKEQGLDKAGVPSKSERPSLALCATVDASVEAAPVTQAPPGEDGYKITIEWDGKTHEVMCDPDSTILDAASDAGLDMPHSCMAGSCFTCPGKIISGSVDQSEGVLDDDQIEQGYILTCVSHPLSDVHFKVVSEDELP